MTTLFVSGSPSARSRSSGLVAHLRARLVHAGLPTEHLALRELPAQPLLHGDATAPGIAEALDRVARADAVVIATPVYKASYSGLLKVFLDLLPQYGLEGKILLPVATGGSLAHALVLDYALRPVLAAAGATHVLPGVFVTDGQLQMDPVQGLCIDADLQRRLDDAVGSLVRTVARLRIAATLADVEPGSLGEFSRRCCSG
ncbi:MAG: NADPH-dependent FMN reductase [Burkholderiales bacterium]|nr:NADPH-dependent FMN reductase [Burkholderiales bacterium]